ncbi:CsbD family protein [Jeotgalibaca dankookensis]|uniref:CsbD family protein n=1 Tax=Jeotgalibaca dankookensis TaxID=708126 RepID=UPI0009E59F09|nr:CsbD family protein [Jeotgalibaca dankookensis]
MGLDDKIKNKKDQVVGKVKEEYGDATDNKSKELEGKAQKIKGKVSEKLDKDEDDSTKK